MVWEDSLGQSANSHCWAVLRSNLSNHRVARVSLSGANHPEAELLKDLLYCRGRQSAKLYHAHVAGLLAQGIRVDFRGEFAGRYRRLLILASEVDTIRLCVPAAVYAYIFYQPYCNRLGLRVLMRSQCACLAFGCFLRIVSLVWQSAVPRAFVSFWISLPLASGCWSMRSENRFLRARLNCFWVSGSFNLAQLYLHLPLGGRLEVRSESLNWALTTLWLEPISMVL